MSETLPTFTPPFPFDREPTGHIVVDADTFPQLMAFWLPPGVDPQIVRAPISEDVNLRGQTAAERITAPIQDDDGGTP
jgi:hypothetical protein